MSETVALNSVVAAISEACFASCPVRKREVMFTLEQFQSFDGYVEALVGIIDINSVGSTMKVDCRHLAAVLLKNLVGKRPPPSNCTVGCVRNVSSNVAADCRPFLAAERKALKSFLAGYLHEPECKVAIQLSLITAKLARQDGDQWCKEWPELVPSLLSAIQGNSTQTSDVESCASAQHANVPNSAAVEGSSDPVAYLRAVRGLTCLNELLTELSSKASVCSSSVFARNYAGLCAHLYPVVSKQWAENMKKLGPLFAKMNAQADASQNTATAYSLNVTGATAFELESLVVTNILICKVLRIVLEYGFELIAAKVTTFFKTFFKCYLNAIKVIADFVRKHRPLCANIRQLRAQSGASVGLCAGNKVSALPVLMKTQLMGDDDVDDLCDAYFPLNNNSSADEGALLSFINLTLKLMKSLVCAPVVLQKKYPMLLLPAMNCLLDYYYNLLVDEYTYSAQPCEMSIPQVAGDATHCAAGAPLTGASLSQVSAEQQAWLYRQEEVREALPLNYLMKATAYFMSNVLSCSAYDEYNIYQQPPCALGGDDSANNSSSSSAAASTGPCSGADSSTMEESAEVKSAVAGACDLRKTFFSAERVTLIVRMLLYPMLTYSTRELEDWSENPEEFVVSQLSAADTCSVKNAAQSLFCGLMELSPDVVCDILARFLMDCSRQETILNPAGASAPMPLGSNSNNQIMAHWAWGRELKIWDAVYMCAGLGVAQLTPYFSKLKEQCEVSGQAEACRAECPSTFTDNITPTHVASQEGASYWVQHYLGPMVQELLKFRTAGCLPQGQQLLRARLIWLLSVWMHKFDASVLQHVLTILIDIVGPASDSDIVVKMYAIQALEALINLEIFDISVLKFQVVSAVEALCLLVRSLEEADCKVTVLQLAGELIRLLSVQMTALKPLVVPLAEYLENLWSETVEADPSRCTILEVMALLVKAGKGHSASILAITTPLISIACRSASSGSGNSRAAYARSFAGASSSAAVGGCSGPAKAVSAGPAACNGYLVKDGIALWLAVMQNLTEAQYATYHGELQHLLCVALEGLNFTAAEGAPCQASYRAPCNGTQSSQQTSGAQRWDLLAEADGAELVTDLMLVVEAYALLGGETHSVLLDPCCRGAITALYCRTLGKVDAKVVQYVVRPLQALLISCPILAGQYFTECGLLNHIARILNASVGCPHLKKLMESHQEPDLALLSYLTFVAQVLLLNPSALYSALTALKIEILTHIQSTSDQPVSDQMLTESILLSEIVSLMFRLFDQLKYSPAPLFKCKLWALALQSLFPPTLVNNAVFIPPNAGPMNTSGGLVQKPMCIIGRTMLMIMDTVQFTMGRAKLEQHLRENCPTAQRMDFRSLSFWFPSTVTAQQLYYWTEPILNISKGVLKDERNKKAKARMLRQLSALLSGGSSESALDIMAECDESDSDDDSDCECSSDEGSDDGNADALMSMKSSGSDLEDVAGRAESLDAEMGANITAQNGDTLNLDVPELPIATVHRNRLLQSGLLTASIEAHLTEKLSQLCRTLGEEQFSTLRCIADLHL